MQGKPAIPDVFTMSNCAKAKPQNEERIELHDKLSLTGAEISVNRLPAGAGVPFAHSRKSNEEIYGILEGAGKAVIDGAEIPLAAGDWLKIAPPQSGSSSPQRIAAFPASAFSSKGIPSAALPQTTQSSIDFKKKRRHKPRFFLLPAKIEFPQPKSKQIESLPDSICGKMGTKYRFELPRF